ncbi:MAG: histidinol-phosphatase HisJ family protein [Lachnospiraceae bacterium]|nr:histidinol-phosphatase HisJ family protein [Lachnospiraceae bacterium]
MLLADTHTHTKFSSDSEAEPAAMLAAAQAAGLSALCFTDHMDLDFPGDASLFVFDPAAYFKELLLLKEKAASAPLLPELFLGIELGLRPNRPDLRTQMDELLAAYPFDFVIGSTHVVDELDPYYQEYWELPGDRLRRYFETVYINVKEHTNFDSLGHLDYIIRYLPDSVSLIKDYHVRDFMDLIDAMLRLLVSRGQALEINTAGLRKGLSFPHPKAEILIRYRELGGELLTLGSDAHYPSHVGADIQKTAELLKDHGFRYYSVYKERKPEMVSLL